MLWLQDYRRDQEQKREDGQQTPLFGHDIRPDEDARTGFDRSNFNLYDVKNEILASPLH